MEPKEAVPLNSPVTIVDPSASVLTDAGATVEPVDADDCVAHGIDTSACAGLAPTPTPTIMMVSRTNLSIRRVYTSGIVFSQIASCCRRILRHAARNGERRLEIYESV